MLRTSTARLRDRASRCVCKAQRKHRRRDASPTIPVRRALRRILGACNGTSDRPAFRTRPRFLSFASHHHPFDTPPHLVPKKANKQQQQKGGKGVEFKSGKAFRTWPTPLTNAGCSRHEDSSSTGVIHARLLGRDHGAHEEGVHAEGGARESHPFSRDDPEEEGR